MKLEVEFSACRDPIGGIGIYVAELLQRLENSSYTIKGVQCNFLGRRKSSVLDNTKISYKEYKILPYWFFYKKALKPLSWIYNTFIRGDADVYVFPANYIPYGFKKKCSDSKIVLILHDVISFYKEYYSDAAAKNIRESADKADIIVTVSQFSKSEIMRVLNVEDDKIKIVSPGANITAFSNKYEACFVKDVMDKYHVKSEYFIYIGAIGGRKNTERLIESFIEFKKESGADVGLVLVGHVSTAMELIIKLVQGENQREMISHDIKCIENISENEKIVLLQNSLGMCFPTLSEGFGIPALEAMAAGAPLIASNAASIPEVTKDAAIYIDPTSVEQITEAMHKVFEEPDLREQLRQKGYTRARELTWEDSIESFTNILEGILK